MDVLILGGTRFVGRHLVDALLARNHGVTLFNRGRSAPGLFPGVEELHGDRDGDLAPLAERRWDAVIDTSGYVPRIVRQSCELLQGRVDRYVFISTISVYADLAADELDEGSALAPLPDPATEDVPAHYGALKGACEREVVAAFGERALIVRPGLIVGPFDPTGRFSYWPLRLAEGGEVLAPGAPDAPVQFIDVRDLAEWIVRAVTRGPGGVFNATGPATPMTMAGFLDACARVVGSSAHPPRFTWCSESFLLDQGVAPWTGLPLWVPDESAGIHRVSVRRALDAGLSFRTAGETARDTLAWCRSPQFAPPVGSYANVGLTRAREAELLAAWHAMHPM